MARMPRLVVPGLPHHVTQRGNRRMKTFFCDGDYLTYLDLLTEFRSVAGASISVNAGRGIFGDHMVAPQDPQEIMGSLIN